MGPEVSSRKGIRVRVVVALVCVMLVALMAWWASGTRQSAVRVKWQSALRGVVQAAEIYQRDFKEMPTIEDLMTSGLVEPRMLKGFSSCEPLGTPADGGDVLLVQTVPCRAVRKGEAWGGPGETIDHDLPACRFVLMRDWSVRQVDEAEYQRDIAPRFRLTPVH